MKKYDNLLDTLIYSSNMFFSYDEILQKKNNLYYLMRITLKTTDFVENWFEIIIQGE